MGYSLNGLNPTSKKGKYSGPWTSRTWGPLWELCCQLGAGDLINKKLARAGSYNDGAGLDAKDSARLAERLTAIINLHLPEQMEAAFKASGHTLGEVKLVGKGCVDKKGRKKTDEQCCMFAAKDVRELRDFFRDCGGFTID